LCADSTTVFPDTPGIGGSPAAYTSITQTRSASPKQRPNSSTSDAVRV
jgi:hypothetical protein